MGQSAKKASKEKKGEHDHPVRHEPQSLSHEVDPQAAILDFHDTAGNKAVSRLLRANLNNHPTGQDQLPPIVQDVLHSTGKPLDPETRTLMEARFNQDFSKVQIHTDTRAAASAETINAEAYTVGNDVVFGANQYTPNTLNSQQLLAHELAHVVHQHRSSGHNSNAEASYSSTFEVDADNAATAVKAGEMVSVQATGTPPAIQMRRRRGRDPYAYTNASLEAQRLWWALRPERSRQIRLSAISRFHGFTHRQVIQITRIWRRKYKIDLPGLVEIRLGKSWSYYTRRRLYAAENNYRSVKAQQHRRRAAKRERQRSRRIQQVAQRELKNPTTPLGRFLQKRYDTLSTLEQQGVQGLLYLVHVRRRHQQGWLQPGNKYSRVFGRRWYLGEYQKEFYWMDDHLRVFKITDRNEMLEAFYSEVVKAKVWVPILQGVAIFATIVFGGILLAPTGIGGAVGAVGRALLTTGGQAAAVAGTSALGFYLTHPILVNEIGLFTVGVIISVEGDIVGLARSIYNDPIQGLPLLLQGFMIYGTVRTPRGSTQSFSAPAKPLSQAQQTTPGRTLIRLTGKPRIGTGVRSPRSLPYAGQFKKQLAGRGTLRSRKPIPRNQPSSQSSTVQSGGRGGRRRIIVQSERSPADAAGNQALESSSRLAKKWIAKGVAQAGGKSPSRRTLPKDIGEQPSPRSAGSRPARRLAGGKRRSFATSTSKGFRAQGPRKEEASVERRPLPRNISRQLKKPDDWVQRGEVGYPKIRRNVYPPYSKIRSAERPIATSQVDQLSKQLKQPIPKDRVLEAPWTGRTRASTSQGYERNSTQFWKTWKQAFPNDAKLLGPGNTVTTELAKKYGWPYEGPNSVVGQKLIHHHIDNGPYTVALPESWHKGSSTLIHRTATVEAKPN